MKKLIILHSIFFISYNLFSQREYGIEYQHGFGKSYHSNSIGVSLEKFNERKSRYYFVAHYTWDIFSTDKKTKGVSDFGFSIGYRYGCGYGDNGNFLTGFRVTLSFLTEELHRKLTPSAELGYHHTFNGLYMRGGVMTPSLAFAYDFPLGINRKENFKGLLFIPRIVVGHRTPV